MNFQELIDQLLANSWRAGILIAALFAFRGVLRRFLDARVIYWFWVLVALRLLLPFDVPVSVSAARYLPLAPWTYAGDFDAGPSVSTSEPVESNSVAPPAAASLREILLNEKTLAIVWSAGVATVLLAYFWASLSFRRQLSRSGRRAGKRTEQAVSSCSRAMGLNPIPVLEMDALSGPALFGVWRPRLLFPLGLADQLSDEELRLVVLHELGHLKRRDLFLQGLLVVSQAVHWFNPLVWLAGRLAREDRELACDEFVMAHTSHSGSHAYAKTLLRVLGLSRPGRPMLPAVGILETKNQIKQRIIMITKYQSTNARRIMLGAASILAVSAGLLMVNAAESGSNASTPAAAAATGTAAPAMPNKISITPKDKNTFKNGDGIEIKEVLGSVPNFQVGGTYRVKGICRQQTLDSAQLYMGNTVKSTGEGDFGQNAIIPVGATWLYTLLSKGSTEFEYVFKLLRPGTLHITIYDGGGTAYTGIDLGAVRQQTQEANTDNSKSQKTTAMTSNSEVLRPVFISSVYWWDTLPRDDWRRSSGNESCAWRDTSGKKHLLLHADFPSGKMTVDEVSAFLHSTDLEFFLVHGVDRFPVRVSADSVWRGRNVNGFELEIVLEPETFAALNPGQTYALEPRNATGWTISPAVSVTLPKTPPPTPAR